MDCAHDFLADNLQILLPKLVDKSNVRTQVGIYYCMLLSGGALMYLTFASISFLFFFIWKSKTFAPEKPARSDLFKQAKHEIRMALSQLPLMAFLMLPFPVLAHRGFGKVYQRVEEYGWVYLFISIPLFIAVTDCLIYFIHRGLHHPLMYKPIHKLHHTYKWCTPFSSHAFHSIDGFSQGVPYYIFIFIFPFHHILWVCMFLFVNFWTISIHDQVDFGILNWFINTTDHHTIHHVDFKYNYGQYLTLWDKWGGSHKQARQTHTIWGKRLATSKH
jgi:lathosterol oxidase